MNRQDWIDIVAIVFCCIVAVAILAAAGNY